MNCSTPSVHNAATVAVARSSIFSLRLEDLQQLLESWDVPPKKAHYHSHQIFKWVYQRQVTSFEEMTDLAKKLRELLIEHVSLEPLPRVFEQKSTDGTRKFLFGLKDGKTIETVLIPAEDRLTICVSSQVGCAMGCKFCNTASQGLERNLEVHEIVGQVMELSRVGVNPTKITNIVFMGMGEPLHNLENLARAIEILLTQDGLNFSKRKITVSTSGLVPAIRKLNERLTGVNKINLAISLNGSFDAQRESIMPVNKAFNIDVLMEACRDWDLEPHRSITFEYVLLGGLNDSLEDAARVAQLVKAVPSKVNLIPYNPHMASLYARPEEDVVVRFQDYLINHGVPAMIRHSRGRDILAACGQLKSQFNTQ